MNHWPKPPKPSADDGNVCTGFAVAETIETPMHDRRPSGSPISWPMVSLVPETTVCKHGKGSCETCGTTTRRDVGHTTVGGKGAVGRIRGR